MISETCRFLVLSSFGGRANPDWLYGAHLSNGEGTSEHSFAYSRK